MAWGKACRPPELGGLGISDLKTLSWALRMRWVWLQRTEPGRPWAIFPIHVPGQVHAFYNVAVVTEVGSGTNTLFWADRWLHGHSIGDLAPHLLAVIPKRTAKKRTVQEAFIDHAWVQDIRGAMTVETMLEFLNLWDLIHDFQLHPK